MKISIFGDNFYFWWKFRFFSKIIYRANYFTLCFQQPFQQNIIENVQLSKFYSWMWVIQLIWVLCNIRRKIWFMWFKITQKIEFIRKLLSNLLVVKSKKNMYIYRNTLFSDFYQTKIVKVEMLCRKLLTSAKVDRISEKWKNTIIVWIANRFCCLWLNFRWKLKFSLHFDFRKFLP